MARRSTLSSRGQAAWQACRPQFGARNRDGAQSAGLGGALNVKPKQRSSSAICDAVLGRRRSPQGMATSQRPYRCRCRNEDAPGAITAPVRGYRYGESVQGCRYGGIFSALAPAGFASGCFFTFTPRLREPDRNCLSAAFYRCAAAATFQFCSRHFVQRFADVFRRDFRRRPGHGQRPRQIRIDNPYRPPGLP